jgi:hypothetical protein
VNGYLDRDMYFKLEVSIDRGDMTRKEAGQALLIARILTGLPPYLEPLPTCLTKP